MKTIIALCTIVSLANAAPIYVRIAGNVFNYQDELGYFATERGITGNGQEVEYQFMVDYDLPGWLDQVGSDRIEITGDAETRMFNVDSINGSAFNQLQALSGLDAYDIETGQGFSSVSDPTTFDAVWRSFDVETNIMHTFFVQSRYIFEGDFVANATPIGCFEEVVQFQEDGSQLVSHFDVQILGLKSSTTNTPPSAKRPPPPPPVVVKPPLPEPPVVVTVDEPRVVWLMLVGCMVLTFVAARKRIIR